MAIPISNYIDISSTIIQNTADDRDFSGLVFTKTAMLEASDANKNTAYTDKITDFNTNGKVVSLSYEGVVKCFGANSDIAKFAAKYFSYNGAGGVPRILNVAKYSEDSIEAAYNRVIADFTNFGSFTFLGAEIEDLSDITPSNVVMIVAVDKDGDYPSYWSDNEYVHCVIGNKTVHKHTEKPGTPEAKEVEDWSVNLAAWMPMAWFASVNYANDNAAGTINYKTFSGETATIDTKEGKATADAAKMNYIGRVQTYGVQRQFYQTGVNQNGTDLGVIRDKMYLQSRVEQGWFNLVGSVNKIPANTSGAQTVYSMIVGIAMDGVANGCILANKTLSASKQAIVLQYAGTEAALDAVQTKGFYVAAEVIEDGNKYACRYILIYSKGDHIAKVVGQHILV
jgi:hypothetical protein